jgi:hypothetical protein
MPFFVVYEFLQESGWRSEGVFSLQNFKEMYIFSSVSGVGFLFRLYHLYIIYISVWAHFCFNHGIISYNRFILNMSLSQLMNVLCLPVVSALYAHALFLRHRGVQNPLVSGQGETVPFAEDCRACCLLRIICSV